MKRIIFLLLFFCASFFSYAGHIAGGEVFYKYLGPGGLANTDKYEITLRLFRECNPPVGGQPIAEMPPDVWLGIFRNAQPAQLQIEFKAVPRASLVPISLTTPGPCITNAPVVCYQVGTYTVTTDLPVSTAGYVISYQTCCRTNNITNLPLGGAQGATYVADIPGTTTLATGKNSSAVFVLKDTTLVCKSVNMNLDFSATDPDGDSLSYSFCPAYNGGNTTSSTPVQPSLPPYGVINYVSPFTGSQPLGNAVTINPRTGMITGIAPGAGSYVVNVCVSEFRNGSLLTIHRKDFTLKIGDCSTTSANLNPNVFFLCDSLTRSFVNGSTSPNINSYAWEFGDPASGASNTSTLPTPSHTYSDTGVFKLKLTVSNNTGCTATDSAVINVFPGFNADFTIAGSCFQTPFQFTDRTTTAYGTINSWRWDFGELTKTDDTSRTRNPSYQYPSPGPRTSTLIVTNTKGCSDTITRPVAVQDVPALSMPFKDTLICSIDTLQIVTQGNGVFTWTPNINILNPNTSSPLVFPKDTITYVVTLNENGCIKRDSLKVNVVDFIRVDAGRDTSICRGDSMVIRTVSDALQYVWSPGIGINNAAAKRPIVSPVANTTYYVTGNVGKCQDRDSINIRVAPYPFANAGRDTSICFGEAAQLIGSTVGSSYTWSPAGSLAGANTLTPVANPVTTTAYVLSAFDTIGCPKPGRDTVLVNVNPRIRAFAGNDTSIVLNQPLQLNATGGTIYAWSPGVGMNNTNIPNPLVNLTPGIDSITYRVRVSIPIGCAAEDDIKVRVFKTGPDIFVPTAFTPNQDGKNDGLKPILVGMRSLSFFRIYNRWGQLVYNTSEPGRGWDGKISGADQGSGTFVFMAEGVDFLGNKIVRKGTTVLIR
ncbi:PKD domain-containing protein [Segetibacter sp. 3557_3]|uniref:PKD domain-containing protein n=1 Tax=Segetibacter sp. 3557_3 TaxID=2547429 RepID=UPI001059186E|nr:PKD domain-containing protein [Segetibacter sp. 3557_3]TDH21243.1 PKD domain-containing protein [Segetibacter sp. 3557_3]